MHKADDLGRSALSLVGAIAGLIEQYVRRKIVRLQQQQQVEDKVVARIMTILNQAHEQARQATSAKHITIPNDPILPKHQPQPVNAVAQPTSPVERSPERKIETLAILAAEAKTNKIGEKECLDSVNT